jgi:WD40 repeat protein
MPSGQSSAAEGTTGGLSIPKGMSSKRDMEEHQTSDGDMEGPMPPPRRGTTSEDVEGFPEPEYEGYESEEDLPPFPITHEVVLKDHTKVISALGLDPSGARLVSGSYDYDLKLWDFGGMDSRCKPFKSWEPAGSYYVRFSLLSWLTLANPASDT